jgi:hypothetical protein
MTANFRSQNLELDFTAVAQSEKSRVLGLVLCEIGDNRGLFSLATTNR